MKKRTYSKPQIELIDVCNEDIVTNTSNNLIPDMKKFFDYENFDRFFDNFLD